MAWHWCFCWCCGCISRTCMAWTSCERWSPPTTSSSRWWSRRMRRRRRTVYSLTYSSISAGNDHSLLRLCAHLHVSLIVLLTLTNAEAPFIQSTRTQRFLKASKHCYVGIHWIARSHWVLSGEYTCARVSIIFASFVFGKISHQQHKDYISTQCSSTVVFTSTDIWIILYRFELKLIYPDYMRICL